MVLSGKFLFGVDWGMNVGLVIGIGILYIFVMTALSLLVVSIVRTTGQLGAVSPIILTGMGMLGGCMWPLEIISSKALLFLANFTPHKWAIAAIKEVVVYGAPSQTTLTAIMVLVSMGILFLGLGERVMYYKSLRNN
jgi:ABC-2 type transport system permease protein